MAKERFDRGEALVDIFFVEAKNETYPMNVLDLLRNENEGLNICYYHEGRAAYKALEMNQTTGAPPLGEWENLRIAVVGSKVKGAQNIVDRLREDYPSVKVIGLISPDSRLENTHGNIMRPVYTVELVKRITEYLKKD